MADEGVGERTEENSSATSGALTLLFLRQGFYYQQLQLVLAAVLLNILVILILMGMIIYLYKNPVHPIYFATDNVGRLVIEPPLSQPNMRADQVAEWAKHAVEQAYSYDYLNYRAELQSAEKYFTDYGWKRYMEGLKASNNLLALTERKLIVIATVVDTPKLVVQGILGGRYAWKFEMPLLLTAMQPPYDDSDKSRFQNPMMVTVVVTRQKVLESDHGLGIVQTVGNLVFGGPSAAPAPGPTK